MAIQSVVDWHVRNGNLNITIDREAGDLLLPENVNVHLFRCKPGKITASEGANAIFLRECEVSGVVTQNDGSFIAENTRFIDEIFWKESNRVSVRDSIFEFRVTAMDNTHVDLTRMTYEGKGSFGLLAMGKSRIQISRSTIKKREKAAWAQSGSLIELSDCILATEIGIIAEDHAMVRMLGGENKATKLGVDAKNRAQVFLSALKSPLIASDHHVKTDDSFFHSEGTDYAQTANVGVEAKNNSIVEIINFQQLKSTGGNTIDANDDCKVLLVSGEIVESSGGKAIYATKSCKVRAVAVGQIKGVGNDGVHVDNESKFTAVKGNSIKSQAKAAIRGTNNSTVSVRQYTEVSSTAEEACYLDLDSRAWFANTDLLQSNGKDAIKLSNEADITFQNCGAILSLAMNGIYAEINSTVQLQTIKSCTGQGGSGIVLKNNTNLDAVYFGTVEGKAAWGIDGDQNCDIRLRRTDGVVKGTSGGVKNTSGGTFKAELVTDIVGKGGPAMRIVGGEAKTKKTKLTGETEAISSANSTLNFENATITGNVTSDNDTYDMERTAITNNGSFTAQNSTINMEIGGIGSLTVTNCTIDVERINGTTLTMTGSSGIAKHGVFTSIVVGAGSNLMVMKTTGPITGTGNVFNMGGGSVAPGANRIEMKTGLINIQNDLEARITELGPDILIDTTESGGDVVTTT